MGGRRERYPLALCTVIVHGGPSVGRAQYPYALHSAGVSSRLDGRSCGPAGVAGIMPSSSAALAAASVLRLLSGKRTNPVNYVNALIISRSPNCKNGGTLKDGVKKEKQEKESAKKMGKRREEKGMMERRVYRIWMDGRTDGRFYPLRSFPGCKHESHDRGRSRA